MGNFVNTPPKAKPLNKLRGISLLHAHAIHRKNFHLRLLYPLYICQLYFRIIIRIRIKNNRLDYLYGFFK